MKPEISIDSLLNLDVRVGTITEAKLFEKALKPAIQLWIDFGDLGLKQSSAQITKRYTPAELIGRQVVAIVNFPAKRIAGFRSECLVLGATDETGDVVLLRPDENIPNGWPIA
jgi:tRNA-binding protein